MLKVGTCGFIGFSLPIDPGASQYFAWPIIVLDLIAIIYIGHLALVQPDMKEPVDYARVPARVGLSARGLHHGGA
jgi:NADH-quinone oxidoreductase subunit M